MRGVERGAEIPSFNEVATPMNTEVCYEPDPDAELLTGSLNPVVVFTGPSGSGKDHVARELVEAGFNADILGFGQMLSRAMSVSRDELSGYRPEDLEEYYPAIVEATLDQAQAPVILTAHPVFKQGETLCFNPTIYTAMNPVAFVFIDSDPEQVVEWRIARARNQDESDGYEDPAHIGFMNAMTQAIMSEFARRNGAGFIVQRNSVQTNPDVLVDLGEHLDRWLSVYCETTGESL